MALADFRRAAARSVSVAWMLAAKDWTADLRQSRFSLAWPLVQPLAYTFLFIVLRPVMGAGVRSHPADFAVFVFIGFTLWQTWFEVLRAEMDAIRRNKGLMSRGELGSATLVLATAFSSAMQLLPRLVVAIAAAVLVLGASPAAVAGLVVFSLATLANGAVIGAILQPFATLASELGKIVQSFSLGLMVTGAVFIPFPAHPPHMLSLILALNPMGTLLNAARAPLFLEPVASPAAVACWLAFTVAIAALLPAMGRRVLPVVIERLGG